MKTKKQKKPEVVYCLYIFPTTNFISFKIERGKLLGQAKLTIPCKNNYVVEHDDNDVEYLRKEDIYKSENDALRGLVKILEKKLK